MSTDIYVTVALNVRTAREAKGFTQREVAARCGWSESGMMISHVEGGRRLPSLPSLVRLADVLDVTTDYLVGRCAP